MASPPEDGLPGPKVRQQKRSFMPPQVVELIIPPLQVGAYTGTAGLLAGVGGAIARDTNPFTSGVLSGVQWFTLGSSYWFARTVGMKVGGGEEKLRSIDKIAVSAVAGSTAGAVAGLTRGPTKILPAIVLWGLLGAGGQAIANRSAKQDGNAANDGQSWLSKLSPLKKLSDEEYINMMKEKILKVDVDIALIDDRIAELRKAEQQEKERGVQNDGKSR